MTDRRAFRYALLASLALHAILLFAFPDLVDRAWRAVESAPPLITRLMEPEPPPPAAALPQPQPAPPPAETPAPSKPKVAKALPQREAPATPPLSPAPVPQASPQPVPAPPPVASVPPVPASAPPNVEAAAARTAEQYRMELIALLNRIKDEKGYPPQAAENHWEGDVVLGVVIRRNGKISITVNRGSQYQVLDQQAAQLLGQATREVPLPPALRGSEWVLKDVTLQYRVPNERLVRD